MTSALYTPVVPPSRIDEPSCLSDAVHAAVEIILDSNRGQPPSTFADLFTVADCHDLILVVANVPGMARAMLAEADDGTRVAFIPWRGDWWAAFAQSIHEITEHILRREVASPINTIIEPPCHRARCHEVSLRVQRVVCALALQAMRSAGKDSADPAYDPVLEM